jgi:hypothetical protein
MAFVSSLPWMCVTRYLNLPVPVVEISSRARRFFSLSMLAFQRKVCSSLFFILKIKVCGNCVHHFFHCPTLKSFLLIAWCICKISNKSTKTLFRTKFEADFSTWSKCRAKYLRDLWNGEVTQIQWSSYPLWEITSCERHCFISFHPCGRPNDQTKGRLIG